MQSEEWKAQRWPALQKRISFVSFSQQRRKNPQHLSKMHKKKMAEKTIKII